ncbi:MAG: S-layer homology domain-containing protein, partial [Clostridia bacterium]|nr:S-layer homology domain-containing protein [Clostridia bacterium]
MKKIVNRIVTGILTLSLLAGSVCGAAPQKITSFSDVPRTYWGHDTIMDMTEYGIFKGTSDPVNGIGTFSPEKTMTRAEFITAALRAVYPELAAAIVPDREVWWRGYYVLARDKKILKLFELDDGDLSKPMSREEMAMVMVRCVENMGEELEQRVATSQIADYSQIGGYYKLYVRDCFSYGLLCGVDAKGTFAPSRTLTRAQAATVLCRLVDEDMRLDVEFLEEVEVKEEETKETEKTPVTDRDDDWDDDDRYDDDDRDDNKKPDNDKKPGKGDKDDKDKETTKPGKDPEETDKSEEDKTGRLPWEEPGAKQPKDYTYEEYEALTEIQQQAFQYHMGYDAFDEWLYDAYFAGTKIPWNNGGKHPSEYTLEEYEELTEKQKVAFRNELGAEGFDEWFENAHSDSTMSPGDEKPDSEEQIKLPWEEPGAKQPEDYTYREFEQLTDAQQIAFQNAIDFEAWLERVQGGDSGEEEDMPWDKPGAKRPEDYTYREFEQLTDAQQIAFQNEIDFEAWLERVQG